jgi:hypothetical protein
LAGFALTTIGRFWVTPEVRFGLGRRSLEKICRRERVNVDTLREYERMVREYKAN